MKKIKISFLIIFSFVVFSFLVGCQTQQKASNEDVMVGNENTVTRMFPKTSFNAGEEIDIKIYINLGKDKTYYLFEESAPEEFEIVKGEHDNNKIKVAEIQGASSNIYEYTVRAPENPGSYIFSGEYIIEGMNNPQEIAGEKIVIVE